MSNVESMKSRVFCSLVCRRLNQSRHETQQIRQTSTKLWSRMVALHIRRQGVQGHTMKQVAFTVFTLLIAVVPALAQCSVPKYRVGKLADDGNSIAMHISIDVQDFAPQRLVCLASTLKRHYGDHKSILCEIFSDRRTAEKDVILTGLDDPPVMFKLTTFMHAIYSYRQDESERLYINPDPLQTGPGSPTETIISLPVAGTPQCKIQLNGRCLLVLPTIWPFRSGTEETKESGSVALSGRVAPDGRVGAIRILRCHLTPGEEGDFLKDLAAKNLRAWRFETGPHPDEIRVTYYYRYSPPRPGETSFHVEVQLGQANKSPVEMSLSILRP